MTQLLLDLQPSQPPSLDNFIAGENRELVARLRALAQPGCFDALYLWGPKGSGKTHLLAAVAALALRKRPVLFLDRRPAAADHIAPPRSQTPLAAPHGGGVGSGRPFADHIAPPRSQTPLAAPHGGGVGSGRPFADFHAPPGGLLVVDAVDALDDDAQIALFRIFNTARLIGLGLLLAGHPPPAQLKLREDLRTRIGQTLIYEVKTLNDEQKAAALRRHALERGLKVDDGLVRYLLVHGRRDLPSLMAVLDHLDRATLERQRPATMPLLKDALREAQQLQLVPQDDEPRTL